LFVRVQKFPVHDEGYIKRRVIEGLGDKGDVVLRGDIVVHLKNKGKRTYLHDRSLRFLSLVQGNRDGRNSAGLLHKYVTKMAPYHCGFRQCSLDKCMGKLLQGIEEYWFGYV